MPPRCDIFCRVVDNYGDIGVCWRLARQLASAHGWRVRLWVDDLHSFARICPPLDPGRDGQSVADIDIHRWTADFPDAEIADIVIEAFACALPPAYETAMAARTPPPVWLNLEYLSAEAWVADYHGLPSPHPRLPLTKHFFFPGFTLGTGGVLCEPGLREERAFFMRDPAARADFWQSLGLPPPVADELRISLFSYNPPALSDLLEAWAAGPLPVWVLAPEGSAPAVFRRLAGRELTAGEAFRHGHLTVQLFPFMEQTRFDRLLWACDLNFVRGEDSFVRAQWAARPLVWQIYPQQDGAHWPKLDAFQAEYTRDMSAPLRSASGNLWHAWNGEGDIAAAWQDFIARRDEAAAHALNWEQKLAQPGDLASNLVRFCQNRIE
jgi:uncharacterized repeat protein (TIGR03837 family)